MKHLLLLFSKHVHTAAKYKYMTMHQFTASIAACSQWSLSVLYLLIGVFNMSLNYGINWSSWRKVIQRVKWRTLCRTVNFVDLVSQTAQSHRQELEDKKYTVYKYFILFKEIICSDCCFLFEYMTQVIQVRVLFKWAEYVSWKWCRTFSWNKPK